jgi:tRNA pseudouridine38-40 synthase
MSGADMAAAVPAADAVPLPVWHLTLAYDGSAYHGWQTQPGQTTVQGALETRLRLLFRTPDLRVAATSRTDSGVHALDQHVTFPVTTAQPPAPAELARNLNRWLPDDIRVLAAELREPEFHARHSPVGKAYSYVLAREETLNPFAGRYAWLYPRPLNLAAMRAAAGYLVGEHDFASFAANPKRELDSTIRRLHRVEIRECGPYLLVNVVGERFLYKMVRGLVGFLAYVGRGACPATRTPEVIAARNRAAAADSAPPQGLFLAKVFFTAAELESYTAILPQFGWESMVG